MLYGDYLEIPVRNVHKQLLNTVALSSAFCYFPRPFMKRDIHHVTHMTPHCSTLVSNTRQAKIINLSTISNRALHRNHQQCDKVIKAVQQYYKH